ncbi:MAG: glycan-binding surface protein, partial [Bacteroidota bacterium]
MKMIQSIKLLSLAFLITMVCLACEEDTGIALEEPEGAPSILYIRVSEPTQSDSLLVRADLGSEIVLIGENLGGTRQVWFNDKRAILDPTWVTNSSIFVMVPSKAPGQVTNTIYLVDEQSDTLAYPFEVSISGPEIHSAVNEWPQNGENLVIDGNFFFEPISITYAGGETGELVSVSQDRVEFTIPDGAAAGPVTISTNFGEVESGFHLWDSRNIILNFDNLNPNGWRIGNPETGAGAINGNYNAFRGNIGASVRDEGPGAPAPSPLLFHYWGGGDPARSENFYPLFPNSYRDYVMKFEARVDKWFGGYLNICLASPDHVDNNQEIWSNDLNARAIWGPWEDENAEFSTDGQWITVVIPMTDFQYRIDGDDTDGIMYTPGQSFVEAAAGSLSMWLIGSPENTDNEVEFHID